MCSCSEWRNQTAKAIGRLHNMGVFLPLSGSNAEAASEVLNGMRIAESHVNSQGGLNGVRLSLKVADTSNPDYEFSSAFNSMASDGVKVFNIGFGNETVFLCRTLAGEENIFVNYLSSYAPVTLDSKNSTRIFISAAQQGDVMASALTVRTGLKNNWF
ncbi:MAG: ABC transporter substrate-binding protein [Bacilli bacterium]